MVQNVTILAQDDGMVKNLFSYMKTTDDVASLLQGATKMNCSPDKKTKQTKTNLIGTASGKALIRSQCPYATAMTRVRRIHLVGTRMYMELQSWQVAIEQVVLSTGQG